jgi:hypothetical protein
MSGGDQRRQGVAALTLAALGVVFGDIGTSPLYALHAVFSFDNHAVKPTEAGVYGVISLVFWASRGSTCAAARRRRRWWGSASSVRRCSTATG